MKDLKVTLTGGSIDFIFVSIYSNLSTMNLFSILNQLFPEVLMTSLKYIERFYLVWWYNVREDI